MSVLGYISLKHGVTVASVALRWALQQELVTSVVPSCTLYATDDRPFDRPAQLRQVFSFELDDEDLETLWAISGKEKPSSYMTNLLHDLENFEEVSEGLFLPRSAADTGPNKSRQWFF
jgi:diketogulonate reductase-like aldo/keto reductase